jgi:hypothetical protein
MMMKKKLDLKSHTKPKTSFLGSLLNKSIDTISLTSFNTLNVPKETAEGNVRRIGGSSGVTSASTASAAVTGKQRKESIDLFDKNPIYEEIVIQNDHISIISSPADSMINGDNINYGSGSNQRLIQETRLPPPPTSTPALLNTPRETYFDDIPEIRLAEYEAELESELPLTNMNTRGLKMKSIRFNDKALLDDRERPQYDVFDYNQDIASSLSDVKSMPDLPPLPKSSKKSATRSKNRAKTFSRRMSKMSKASKTPKSEENIVIFYLN